MDYASSGVDIEAGNHAVELIKKHVQSTYSPFVLNKLGGFAAHFELPTGYTQPVLVSCTDGVGTKVKLAIEANDFSTVGIDLVAMCVNDMICSGAKPLFFLDYIACHKLVPTQMEALVASMSEGCRQAGCALVGGEMAEMNELYHPGDFDLAGFSVGVVEKSKVITGASIAPGHFVYALPSSGLHSNGFSLARHVLTESVRDQYGLRLQDLLTPTKIYVNEILDLCSRFSISGIAHITGGGLAENTARVVPAGVTIEIEQSKLPSLPIFEAISAAGQVSDDEMRRVFNMGVGMIVISPEALPESESLIRVGQVVAGQTPVILY